MSQESRFDELDLREEPPRGDVETSDVPATEQTQTCTATHNCTRICCV